MRPSKIFAKRKKEGQGRALIIKFALLMLSSLLFSCALGGRKEELPLNVSAASRADNPSFSEGSMKRMASSPALEKESSLLLSLKEAPNPEPESTASQGRKRVYNGSATLIVDELEQARREIETLAIESGGYLERSYQDSLTLRIPAADFQEVFNALLALGEVESQRVETWDVTDFYTDVERRLAIAKQARQRLYTLLEKSSEPEEVALILKEIGRLSEEIDNLEQQITRIEARVSYSRISVQLLSRLQLNEKEGEIPFAWIANLNPLLPVSSRLRARVALDLGSSFAVFSKEKIYAAENSTGESIRIATIDNQPRGENNFWLQALSYHLSPLYAQSSEKKFSFGEKEVWGIEVISKDRQPYRYFVGVLADAKKLHVIEIFSPNADPDFADYYALFSQGSLK